MGFLVAETVISAPEWVNQPYNGHIAGSNALAKAGDITDRNGEVLASTVKDKRVYHEDEDTRKALLHTVGDGTFNISTSVQNEQRSQGFGYSFLWGLNLPDSFRNSGKDSFVELTLDAPTCKAAYEALKEYNSGACVVYNYKTGEIICKVSTKTYDPENPPKITTKNEKKYEGVYLDNTLSSTYMPGSVFKIVTAAAAIENIPDIWERTWHCEGEDKIGKNNVEVFCNDSEAHGDLDLKEAFAQSCNIVFAELADELGEDVMTATAKKLGIDASFKISGINTEKGSYKVSGDDSYQRAWSLAWSGIGQDKVLVNPTQMAILCGAIAGDGTPVIPYYVKSSSNGSAFEVSKNGSKGEAMLTPETAAKLKEIMRYAVENSYGDYMFGGLTVCAKTGTGETSRGDGQDSASEDKNNGWMVGFCTDEDCPLAFACVVKDTGEYGYGSAGQVASAAMIQAADSLRNG